MNTSRISGFSVIRNLLTVVGLVASPVVFGQSTLAEWDFGSAGTNTSTVVASSSNANLSAAPSLGIGSGLNVPAGLTANVWTVNGFGATTSGATTTLATAITSNDFITFTIAPGAGYELDLSTIEFYGRARQTTNTITFSLFSSTNGFSSAPADGDAITSVPVPGTLGLYSFDLSSVAALQNLTSAVTFRLYGYKTASGANTDVAVWIGQASTSDFFVKGSLAAIPEASAFAVFAGAGVLGFAGYRRRRA